MQLPSTSRAVPGWAAANRPMTVTGDPEGISVAEPILRDVVLEGDGVRTPSDADIVEISLLLSGAQATLLEETAHSQGLTTAQMIRHLIREHFARFARPRTA